MGGVKGGSSCYCRENAFLNAIVSALLLDKMTGCYGYGCRIEHLPAVLARGDLMLVVVEPA